MSSWSELPSEILEFICDGVEYPYDVRRIRSVCRSWRSSVAAPARVFSPLFPHRISVSSPPFTANKNRDRPIDLITKAVYLLRSHSDPSNAWMVSMEEANAGKLRLRHAITDEPIVDISPPDLPSSEWSVTEIVRSHSFCFADGTAEVLRFDDWWTRPICPKYRGPNTKSATTGKVILVSNPAPCPSPTTKRRRICDFTSLVLYNRCRSVSVLRLSDDETEVLKHVRIQTHKCEDIVNFNGRIFAIDSDARVYSVDPQTLLLNRIDDSHLEMPWPIFGGRKRLIVSNGELYMFAKFYEGNCFMPPVNACVVYRLVVIQGEGDDDDDVLRRFYKWEYVENLGDQVFFITADFSYSVSAQHLPYPWRGNCVVLDTEGVCPSVMNLKFPKHKEIEVFHLGGGQLNPISRCYGYSNLFTPSNIMLNNTSSDSCEEFVAGKSFAYVELPPDKKANLFNPKRK